MSALKAPPILFLETSMNYLSHFSLQQSDFEIVELVCLQAQGTRFNI